LVWIAALSNAFLISDQARFFHLLQLQFVSGVLHLAYGGRGGKSSFFRRQRDAVG
jgi:hypothetical protein